MTDAAVFLDRDGTINVDHGYVYDPAQLDLISGSAAALKQLKEAGLKLIVITNQSGVARGKFSFTEVEYFHKVLQTRLDQEAKVQIDAFYICPHYVDGKVDEFSVSCDCRKPKTGNLEKAIEDHAIDRENSYFIGDKQSDYECGLNGGVTPILVGQPRAEKPLTFPNLLEAATWITKRK